MAGQLPGKDERHSVGETDTNTAGAIVSVGSVSPCRCVEGSSSVVLRQSVCVFDTSGPGGLTHQQCL